MTRETQGRLRVAGSDTREALATPTVKAAAVGALLGAGPGFASIFTIADTWRDVLQVRTAAVWLTPLMIVAAVATAIATWRHGAHDARAGGGVRRDAEPVLLVAAFAALIASSGDTRLGAVTMPLVVIVAGNAVGRAALLAVRATVPAVWSAAAGVVTVYALAGALPGIHVLLVASGSGVARAFGWTGAYFALSGIMLLRARSRVATDRSRISMRGASRTVPGDERAKDIALACRAVTVRFGAHTVLDHATLDVRRGELVALVGANGAGKSTLLRCAAGFVATESGRISIGSEDVTALLPEERAAAGLSFVSGARPVFPDLTVMQNLRAAAYRTHKTARAFEEATESLLALVPTLAARRDDKAGVLSGGEQRLLAVAQTMYRRPAVLLADELTLGLDNDARLAVMDLLHNLAQGGVAVVAVDHDLPSLLPRSDRVALVGGGSVTMHDDPLEILEQRKDLLPATFLVGIA